MKPVSASSVRWPKMGTNTVGWAKPSQSTTGTPGSCLIILLPFCCWKKTRNSALKCSTTACVASIATSTVWEMMVAVTKAQVTGLPQEPLFTTVWNSTQTPPMEKLTFMAILWSKKWPRMCTRRTLPTITLSTLPMPTLNLPLMA